MSPPQSCCCHCCCHSQDWCSVWFRLDSTLIWILVAALESTTKAKRMGRKKTRKECSPGSMTNLRWPRGSLRSQSIGTKIISPGRSIPAPQGTQTFRPAQPIPSPWFSDLHNLAERVREAESLSKCWFRLVSPAIHVKQNLGKLTSNFVLGDYWFHGPKLKI